MHAPHIVLIDTHGTIMDYAVSTDVLAQTFTLLQSTSERQDHPMLKPEYLGTREPKPTLVDMPSVRDVTPVTEGDGWRLFEGLTDSKVEIEFDEKPHDSTRLELRRHGFRWNHKTQRWYGDWVRIPAQYFVDPKPEAVADIPSFLPPRDKAPVVTLVKSEPEKPSEPDDAAFAASLSNLFKNT